MGNQFTTSATFVDEDGVTKRRAFKNILTADYYAGQDPESLDQVEVRGVQVVHFKVGEPGVLNAEWAAVTRSELADLITFLTFAHRMLTDQEFYNEHRDKVDP